LLSKKYLFPLLAFTIPLLVRTIPEVLMGPYVVGFDTMAHYVPTTLAWLHSGVDLASYIATAPLLYTLTVGLASFGLPVVFVLKVLPPVLLGFLGLSIYVYARRGLSWSPLKSMVPALVGTLYFVALRVSWDALREELALIFVFVVLTALVANESKFSWRRYVLFCLGLVAVVLSNQVVAVIMLGVVTFTVVSQLFRRNHLEVGRLVLFSLPALMLFFATFFLSPAVPEYRLIFGFPNTPDGWLAMFGYASYPAMLVSEAGFFLYCFVPLLPLVLLSVRRLGSFQMRSWVVLIFVAALIPMVSPSVMRVIMLLTYPFAFYAAEGLSRLKAVNWRRFRVTLLRLGVVYLVVSTAVLSLGFMLMTPAVPFTYFKSGELNGYIYQIPSSMLQNTVPAVDCQDTSNVLQWYKNNVGDDSILLTHRAFYGWAMQTLNERQVFLYEYDNPANAAATVTQQGHDQIYLVWWINGKGWNGQPTVASTFLQIYQSGEIAIYKYTPE
jgi:hypothetical protein